MPPSLGHTCARAQEALYCGIKGPTSHLVNQHALNWIVEGLRRLPRTIGGPHQWVVRLSSHLVAIPLEEPDFAVAHAKAPPVHPLLPNEHATLLVPRDDGELEPHVPSMHALQKVRETEWRSLAARTRAHTRAVLNSKKKVVPEPGNFKRARGQYMSSPRCSHLFNHESLALNWSQHTTI